MGPGFTCCIAVTLLGAGCQSQGGPCASMDAPDPVFAHAAVTRVELYGAGAACNGSGIAPGAGAPILSRVFAAGGEITLDVPEGQVVVLFQGFADAAMTMLIGSNCSTANVSPGSGLCLSLRLVPTVCFGPADCDRGFYCEAGQCVAGCAAAEDCTAGSLCCDHRCVNPAGDPRHCGGCGQVCHGNAALCCAGVCFDGAADVYHCGSCERSCLAYRGVAACVAGACGWTCDPGFAHCGGILNSGCETSLTSPTDCGSCGTARDSA